MAVQLVMMVPAQRHGKFVADLTSQGFGLGELEMVGVTRRALADQTGLRRNEGQMFLAAMAHRLDERADGLPTRCRIR